MKNSFKQKIINRSQIDIFRRDIYGNEHIIYPNKTKIIEIRKLKREILKE